MISAAGDQFHINGDWCAISLYLWQPYDNVIHVEIVFKGWNHFGGIPSFFRDWALGDTDRLRINKGPSCVKNYLTPLCKEAAASIDQKLDAPSRRSIKTRHYYDHEMHKTTCNCAHLVPDFFFVHMVCGIFTQDLSIFFGPVVLWY